MLWSLKLSKNCLLVLTWIHFFIALNVDLFAENRIIIVFPLAWCLMEERVPRIKWWVVSLLRLVLNLRTTVHFWSQCGCPCCIKLLLDSLCWHVGVWGGGRRTHWTHYHSDVVFDVNLGGIEVILNIIWRSWGDQDLNRCHGFTLFLQYNELRIRSTALSMNFSYA